MLYLIIWNPNKKGDPMQTKILLSLTASMALIITDVSAGDVLSGTSNTAAGSKAVVAGGLDNHASGYMSAVLGGRQHNATGNYATVGGGYINKADGYMALVAGGR